MTRVVRLYLRVYFVRERCQFDVVRAVYGVDELSGASDLVTALLEDPFVSDDQKKALRTRWDEQAEGSRSVRLQ